MILAVPLCLYSYSHRLCMTVSLVGIIVTFIRKRQIIRYRATVTLRRPQIKHHNPSNEMGRVQSQREHHIILTKCEVVHPTAVSENNSSSWMLFNLTITRTVCILSSVACFAYYHNYLCCIFKDQITNVIPK